MAPRGFLKDTGVGSKRLRFVKAPYSADDLSLPGNQVIFDSEDIGNFSVHASGYWDSGIRNGVGVAINNEVFATWPALPFVPLILLEYYVGQYPSGENQFGGWGNEGPADTPPDRFRIVATLGGMYMFYQKISTGDDNRIAVKWTAYRYPG